MAGHRRSLAVVGGATIALALAALVIGVRVDLHGNPASADTVLAPEVERDADEFRSTRAGSSAARPSLAMGSQRPSLVRRFVWAPVPDASGYHFEVFRASTLVFSAETKRAEMSIPKSWTLAGARKSLEPGVYRWYVWPVTAGKRGTNAIVQAKLVVSKG